MNDLTPGGVDSLKYRVFDDRPGTTHNEVVDLVPAQSRVLEFGCATGYMSEVLRTRRLATVTGIETNPDAAALARDSLARVIVGDAESLDYEQLFRDEQFDAVLFADVLEHLRAPRAVLERVRGLVAPGGSIIASIPNIAHGSVRLALLAGEFRYRPLGLLDDTHIRFFTRDGVRDLFEESGYVITRWIRQYLDVDASEVWFPSAVMTPAVQEIVDRDPEARVYQYIVQAHPSDDILGRTEARRMVLERDEELASIYRSRTWRYGSRIARLIGRFPKV